MLCISIGNANDGTDPKTQSIIIIVNQSVSETNITRSTLRAIYGMRLHKWSDQLPTRVFILTDTSQAHKDFCEQKLEILPHQMQQAWDRLVYSGTGQAPIRVGTETEMVSKIQSIPGAIGYISAPPTSNAIKVLDVISANP